MGARTDDRAAGLWEPFFADLSDPKFRRRWLGPISIIGRRLFASRGRRPAIYGVSYNVGYAPNCASKWTFRSVDIPDI